jgi:hypothetical protein
MLCSLPCASNDPLLCRSRWHEAAFICSIDVFGANWFVLPFIIRAVSKFVVIASGQNVLEKIKPGGVSGRIDSVTPLIIEWVLWVTAEYGL